LELRASATGRSGMIAAAGTARRGGTLRTSIATEAGAPTGRGPRRGVDAGLWTSAYQAAIDGRASGTTGGRRRCARWMRRPAVRRRFLPVSETVVPNHTGNAQTVVAENSGAPLGLRHAMGRQISPPRHGVLVAPEGQRKQLPGLAETLEALDRDEAVDRRKLGTERR